MSRPQRKARKPRDLWPIGEDEFGARCFEEESGKRVVIVAPLYMMGQKSTAKLNAWLFRAAMWQRGGK